MRTRAKAPAANVDAVFDRLADADFTGAEAAARDNGLHTPALEHAIERLSTHGGARKDSLDLQRVALETIGGSLTSLGEGLAQQYESIENINQSVEKSRAFLREITGNVDGLGRGAEDVEWLGELALRHPLRESLAARLVTALYAAGRQADALAAYERCRRTLAEQLGVDPAPPLRRVHEAVLAQEELGSVSAGGSARANSSRLSCRTLLRRRARRESASSPTRSTRSWRPPARRSRSSSGRGSTIRWRCTRWTPAPCR